MKPFIQKYRYHILGALLILTALTVAFFQGGTAPEKNAPVSEPTEAFATPAALPAAETVTENASPSPAASESPSAAASALATQEAGIPVPTASTAAPTAPTATAKPAQAATAPPAASQVTQASQPTAEPAGQDRYHTDPVPAGVPQPVEPEQATRTGKTNTCTLSIRCDTALRHASSLPPAVAAILPPDGVILAPTRVTFQEGESVFDLLLRETKRNKIHMEFTDTPFYNSAYIEGIGNLYEFDCGELSGWMYKVNGLFPNYGCSRYLLRRGDNVEWVYTCDLGRDVGDTYGTGNGR